MAVYLLATLDTKGAEAQFVRQKLLDLGIPVTLVDCGCLGSPTVTADIPRETFFLGSGRSLAALQAAADRGQAITAAAAAAAALASEAFAAGRLDGVLALGGSAGTTIGTAAMQVLPLGVPKVMVSTLASGQVRQYVRDKDIAMFNSVVDILGVNRVSRPILANAAHAMAGMVRQAQRRAPAVSTDRPLIAATMFGVTTPCVRRAKEILEQAGYEVLVFHATGNGGQAMESLVADGLIAGVLDITTTELADELVGGVLSAGPDRLTAAARRGIPQVVSVGALDMVNFHARDTVPERFAGRTFYQHNAAVTLMRTTPAENRQLGEILASKVAASQGPAKIILPAAGLSAIDRAGEPFDDPAARAELYAAIRAHAGSVAVIEAPGHINDPEFAALAAGELLSLLSAQGANLTPNH